MSNFTGVRVVHVDSEAITEIYSKKTMTFDRLEELMLSNDQCIALGVPPPDKSWRLSPNLFLVLTSYFDGEKSTAIVRVGHKSNELWLLKDYVKTPIYGLKPRNKEQNMLLNTLMDDRVRCQVVIGRAGSGKAQPLDARVLTPNGWTLMGELHPGSVVSTPDGKTANVIEVFPQGEKDIYRVLFSDGSCAECCDEHLWYTKTQKDRDLKREGSVKTLKEIRLSLRYGASEKRNHSIPMVRPIEFNDQELPIDPYVLGALLGDGGLSGSSPILSSQDEGILCKFVFELSDYSLTLRNVEGSNCDYRIVQESNHNFNYLKRSLDDLNLWGTKSNTKFIPKTYKFNSIEKRLQLLRGLMDTDGYISKNGMSTVFYTVSSVLALDVQELVQSLGGKATLTTKSPTYSHNDEEKSGQLCWCVNISMPPDINPFSISRKAERYVAKTKYEPTRYIDKVELVGKKQAQCILLDSQDHLYITDNYVVTHNTICALAYALHQLFERKGGPFKKIILTRPMSSVGEKMGAFPGEAQEKISPYLGNFYDNFEQLMGRNGRAYLESAMTKGHVEIIPIQLIGGSSWHEAIVIADEVQSLTAEQMYALGTRPADGTKLILMGDYRQRYGLRGPVENTGLYKVVNSQIAQKSPAIASLELLKTERSELARVFNEIFEEKV